MRYWLSILLLYLSHSSLWAATNTYGPVAKGEVLWEIAGTMHNDKFSRYSVVLALLYENPQAFTVSCNFNSLKLGSELHIPKAEFIGELNSNAAFKEVKRQEKAWRGHHRGHKIRCGATALSKAWQAIKKEKLNQPKVLQTLKQLGESKTTASPKVDAKTDGIPSPQPVVAQVPQTLPHTNAGLGDAFPNANKAHLLANLQWGVHLNTILISLNLGLTLFLGLLIWRSLAQHSNRLEDIHAHVEQQQLVDGSIQEQFHRLFWLFGLFFKIGLSAFGGFMALVHKIETEVGERHKLLNERELHEGISLACFIPGSMAVNLSTYIGLRLRGTLGAVICTSALLLPSLLLILGLSYLYFSWGHLPMAKEAFLGLIPAMTAILFHAAWVLSYKSVQDPPTTLLAVGAAVVLVLFKGMYISIIVLLLAALLGIILFKSHITPVRTESDNADDYAPAASLSFSTQAFIVLLLAMMPVLFLLSPAQAGAQTSPFSLLSQFLGFGLLSFNGGLGLMPLTEDVLVNTHQWLNQSEFAIAIAMGQLLPEMLLSGAFMAYKIGGITGAILAAVALIVPSFLLTLLVSSAFGRLRKSSLVQAGLLGIRAAVVGMVFATALLVGQTALVHWASLLIFAVAMFMLFHWHLKTLWVVLLALGMSFMLYAQPNLPWLTGF